MKRVLTIGILLFAVSPLKATTFTEFYVNAASVSVSASNLNAGSTAGATAYMVVNGTWTTFSSTASFATPDDPTSKVNVGDFASVFLTTDLSTTSFVGRITEVFTSSITVSITAFAGVVPVTNSGGMNLRVGGCWTGPIGSIQFPFGFVRLLLADAALDRPRVNFINTTTYTVTAGMVNGTFGPVQFEGYSVTPGDGGRCLFLGPTGTAQQLLTVSGTNNILAHFAFGANGTAGTSNTLAVTGQEDLFFDVVVSSSRGSCINLGGSRNYFVEGELYNCNVSNTAAQGGLIGGATDIISQRIISHNNAGSNSRGFVLAGGVCIDCIADTNGNDGFQFGGSFYQACINCNAYNNGGDGFEVTQFATYYSENSNAVKNALFGINITSTVASVIANTKFGTGTQVNGSGDYTLVAGSMVQFISSGTYTANTTPWVSPQTGDFRVNTAQSRGQGRGNFPQSQTGYTGTVSYPDIGAVQTKSIRAKGAVSLGN